MSEAYIIDGVRTPSGSFGGSLSDVRPDDMAALVIQRLLARHPGLDPSRITDVILGCANQSGEDNRNVARMAALLSGLPVSVPGETVNRLCASGLSAVGHAARAVKLGDGDLYSAGGVERLTRAPSVPSKSGKAFARDEQLFDTSIGWRFVNPRMREQYGVDAMGETAENVASDFRVSREDQDRFAYATQRRAAAARARGRFTSEITAVDVPGEKRGDVRRFEQDEFIRADTSLEALARLKPAFRAGGSVTAGNASGINDGAAALLVASEGAVKEFSLKPLARSLATVAAGVEPRIMGMGPVPATRAALARAGLSLAQIDVIELNEAFAAQSIACLRELGLKDDDPRVNPNGGAIALGHPLGMSGARLILSAARELEATGGRYALATMCVGVGQGMATIIERGDGNALRTTAATFFAFEGHPPGGARVGIRASPGDRRRQRDHRPRRVRGTECRDPRRLGRRRHRRRVQCPGDVRDPLVSGSDGAWLEAGAHIGHGAVVHGARIGRNVLVGDERRRDGPGRRGRRLHRGCAHIRAGGHADPGSQSRRRESGPRSKGCQ